MLSVRHPRASTPFQICLRPVPRIVICRRGDPACFPSSPARYGVCLPHRGAQQTPRRRQMASSGRHTTWLGETDAQEIPAPRRLKNIGAFSPFFCFVYLLSFLFPPLFHLCFCLYFFGSCWFHLWPIPTCLGLKGLVVVDDDQCKGHSYGCLVIRWW
jgi:hypothetical protein